MRDKKLYFLIQSALFAAIIAVLAQLAIPMHNGVPITLQTFAIALCGFFLGIKAIVPVMIYILMGAVGMPVFANLKGGIGIITGATGGFIIGFMPMSILCGTSKLFKINSLKSASSIIKIIISIIISLVGLAICHCMGAFHFAKFTNKAFIDVLPLVSYPFILKDVLSIIFAYILAFSINLRLKYNN